MSQGEDPRRLPGGGEVPTPPAPVQVQWPQTVAVIFNPSSAGDSASERGDRIRQAIEETGKKLIWLETTPEDSGQGLAKDAVGHGADLVIALKARIGPLAYVWSALGNLRRPRASYRLRLDGGEEMTRRAQGVLVANLGKIQGGLPPSPWPSPNTTRSRRPQSGRTRTEQRHHRPGNRPAGR